MNKEETEDAEGHAVGDEGSGREWEGVGGRGRERASLGWEHLGGAPLDRDVEIGGGSADQAWSAVAGPSADAGHPGL
jgi:hypothetical protein